MLTVAPRSNASSITDLVGAFRNEISTTLARIMGLPPSAVARIVLRMPDCTEVTLLAGGGDTAEGGMAAVPCTPRSSEVQVLLLADASPLRGGGNSSSSDPVAMALQRLISTFRNTTAYAAAVGSLYSRWDVAANTTSDLSSRTVDLLFSNPGDATWSLAVGGTSGGLVLKDQRLLAALLSLLALTLAACCILGLLYRRRGCARLCPCCVRGTVAPRSDEDARTVDWVVVYDGAASKAAAGAGAAATAPGASKATTAGAGAVAGTQGTGTATAGAGAAAGVQGAGAELVVAENDPSDVVPGFTALSATASPPPYFRVTTSAPATSLTPPLPGATWGV